MHAWADDAIRIGMSAHSSRNATYTALNTREQNNYNWFVDSYFGYETSLWYWRVVASRRRMPSRITRTLAIGTYAHSDAQVQAQRPDWLDPAFLNRAGGTIHALVFDRAMRPSNAGLTWHLWSDVPHESFCPAGEHSFVASPELCFLQMATRLSFQELVLLGMELCGFYCLDPTEEQGFAKRMEALTSVERLGAYLEKCDGLRGKRAAQTAVRYIADRAASPMEAAVYMILTLPYKRGGYGLPRPELNWPIDLNEAAMELYGGPRCWGDICWPKHQLDLEYLGAPSHEGDDNMLADRRRTLAIEETGYEVVEITKEQATNPARLEIVVRRIASKLKKRLDEKQCGETPQRKTLFDVVYWWQSECLPVDDAQPSEGCEADEGRVFGLMA